MSTVQQPKTETDTSLADPRTEILKRRTLSLSIVEGCAWAVMWGFGETFVGPFAVFLKANDFTMSLLATLPLLLGALAQIAGGYLVEYLGRRRSVMVATALFQAIGYIPIFWLPFFFPGHGTRIVVSLATFMLVSNNMGAPGFNSIMGDLVPAESRGRYFGKRNSLIMLTMLVTMLVAGRIVSFFDSRGENWLGFGLVFSIAMVARACSALLLSRYYEPPFHPSTEEGYSFVSFLRNAHRTNLGRFTLAMALMAGATNVSAPFFTQYMLRDMHWTKYQFATSTAVSLLSQFVFMRWWGRISDRHGSHAVVRVCCLLIPVGPLLWALTRDYHLILVVQALSGLSWAGFSLASSNFLYDSVPANQRHRVFGYYTLINGLAVLLGGSVVGAWCATNLPSSYSYGAVRVEFLSSLPAVFIVSSLLRILVGILMFPLFKEVRRTTEPITSRQILWRLTTGEPIMDRLNELNEFMENLPRPFRALSDSKNDAKH